MSYYNIYSQNFNVNMGNKKLVTACKTFKEAVNKVNELSEMSPNTYYFEVKVTTWLIL